MRIFIFLTVATLFFSCKNQTPQQQKQVETKLMQQELAVEAISFTGKNLYRREVDSVKLEKYNRLIDDLKSIENPSEEDYINLGNHYATIFQFGAAIDAYSKGMASYPDSYKILRHRAHRYLSTRKVDSALADLEKALVLIANSTEEAMEYYPNGKVKGTYEYWIWYHLGIGHFLNRNFEKANEAFSKCLQLSITAKNRVGAVDWLYNSYHKAGKPDMAQEVIDAYTFEEDLDLKYPYSQRVMLYKGDKKAEDFEFISKPSSEWTGVEMTVAYGIGSWYVFNGDLEKGKSLFNKVVELPYWNAWAYLLAEKEVAEN